MHVLGHGEVMIGMASGPLRWPWRYSPRPCPRRPVHTVIAVELPAKGAMMHLDTVMTMVDRDMAWLYLTRSAAALVDRHHEGGEIRL